MILVLAVIGALTLFCAVIVGAAFLLASLLPDREIAVRPREPELAPLVPARTRRDHPDIWIN